MVSEHLQIREELFALEFGSMEKEVKGKGSLLEKGTWMLPGRTVFSNFYRIFEQEDTKQKSS